MHFKQKLTYTALGCLFTIIGYILASLGGNVDVQAQGDKSDPVIFDRILAHEITCRRLAVLNSEGKTVVAIRDSGAILIQHPNGEAAVFINAGSYGGNISIHYANGKRNAVFMGIDDSGKEGVIQILTENQKGMIQLSGDDMAIFNKGGETVLQAGVNNMGGGMFITNDKNGYRNRTATIKPSPLPVPPFSPIRGRLHSIIEPF